MPYILTVCATQPVQVSRKHARFEVVAGQLQLVDLGGVNGTYVNNHRLERSSTRCVGCQG